jgi:serine/threonine protein kinase
MLIPFESKSGQPDWGTLQETTVGGFQFRDFLGADAVSAVFRAEMREPNGTVAVVKVYKVDQDSVAETQTEIWEEAKKLDHPNLIKLLGCGRHAMGEHKLIYVAVEPADESLSSALRERTLEADEAVEVLTCTRSALQYLHNRDFVHSCLSPEQIFAVGDAIKLSTEGLRKAGKTQRLLASNPKYLAPESDEANITRSADVWCLGATLVEGLTQQSVSSSNWSLQSIPQQLRNVVQRCLSPDASLRSDLSKIDQESATAHQSKPIARAQEQPVPQIVRPEPPKTLYPRKPERSGLPFWVYAVASIVLIVILVWLFHSSSPASKAGAQKESPKAVPAAQQRTIPPANDTATSPAPPSGNVEPARPAVLHKPSPAIGSTNKPAQPNATQNGPIWRVVVYTYDQQSAADARAAAINKKYPQLHAETFSPTGKSPFLVTVGGAMSRADATRVRRTALSLGMPHDTYAQNYAQ